MKILILGGTQFIGRHVVDKVIEASHNVTLLNRGTAPDLFPNLSLIKVDRQSQELKNAKDLRQDWDAVIDLSVYFPKDVSNMLDILEGRTGRYILCSTISAYAAMTTLTDGPASILTEDSPLLDCTEEQAVDTSMMTYGQRKAECERVAFRSRIPTIAIRPSVVYGAHDYTDRFAYWIQRSFAGKPFILPDDGLTTTARTYVRDLAAAFSNCVTSDAALGNAYNIAEIDQLSFRDTIFHLGKHLGGNPLEHAVSVSATRLLKEGIKPWSDLPFWLPRTNLLIDTFRSRQDLSFASTSPATALARATDAFLAEKRIPKAGMSADVEAAWIEKFVAGNGKDL